MKHELMKEWRFGLRNYRFLILAAGFTFYALLTPVMMKMILPGVIKSQMPGLTQEAMDQMFHMTQIGCIQSYMGDVLEIGAILVAFTLCGLIAQELKENTLVLPLCCGKRLSNILGAKMLVFGTVLFLTPVLSLSINYLYSGLLFSFEIGYLPVLYGGMMQGLFLDFMLVNLLLWGAIFSKPITAGFMTLGTVYVLSIIGGLFKISSWLPTGLMEAAQSLSAAPASGTYKTVAVTAVFILVFLAVALLRLRQMEWNRRTA